MVIPAGFSADRRAQGARLAGAGAAAGQPASYRRAPEPHRGRPVIDLDYSDGLSLVSVFLQRGELPRALPGWQEITLRGSAVYSTDPDSRSLAWSARGFVYTVIAEAPAATVDQVVDSLPHDARPGFWGRIAKGMRRLASWANPFR